MHTATIAEISAIINVDVFELAELLQGVEPEEDGSYDLTVIEQFFRASASAPNEQFDMAAAVEKRRFEIEVKPGALRFET